MRTWPPTEWPEERAQSSPTDHIFGGLSGLDLDAGPSGSCSGRKNQVVFGQLQAKSSRVSGPMSQSPRPHGSGFPSSSLGAAPYETVSLVDEVPRYLSLLAISPPTKSSRGGPLCISGVDPMPPLVLPFLPYLSGDRCASTPLARHETICFLSGLAQGEDVQSPSSPSSPVLAFPDMVLGVGLPSGRRSVGDSNQERPVVSAPGQNLGPTSRDLEVVGMADQRLPIAFGLLDGVRETINSARVLSTRRLYSSKWKVFESWCLAHAVGPVSCPVGSVLEFLQDKFSAGTATTTSRVYVVAIAPRRESDGVPLGRHRLVASFMHGVKRLRPPFEPLESAPERILMLKVTILLVLTSLKRVGDLQALSVSESCIEFAPGLVKSF